MTKNETKHTPGPWRSFAGAVYIGEPESPVFIARASHPDRDGSATVPSGPERIANAHLIAAAPELLATLGQALDWMLTTCDEEGTDPTHHPTIKAARAAIAKAEGGVK